MYIFFAKRFTKPKLMVGSVPVLNIPEKYIIPSSRNIFAIIGILFTLNVRWDMVHFSQTGFRF